MKHELDAMHLLLQARPNLAGLKEQLKNQVLHKLDCISSLQAHDLLEIYGVLEKSPLPKDVLKDITAMVDKKALGAQCAGNTTVIAQAQKCDSLPQYLTAEDITGLQAATMWEGTSILAARMKSLGIRSIKESTKKVAIAILVFFEEQRVESTQVVTPHMCWHRHWWLHWPILCSNPQPMLWVWLCTLPAPRLCHKSTRWLLMAKANPCAKIWMAWQS